MAGTADGLSAEFRFYAELNDFLPPAMRGVPFWRRLDGRNSIKHVIEALGVPHTEVDLILVNGESVGFDHIIENGDTASVYPVFESIDVGAVTRVRQSPLRDPRFVLDGHLGKLAGYLRMLGFDAAYARDADDHELARVSSMQRRILLTMDRGLLKHRRVTHGYCVRRTEPREQAIEVLRRFDLSNRAAPFRRCMRCNGELEPVAKHAIMHRLLPKTRRYYTEFRRCVDCDQIYWKGSHFRRMEAFLRGISDAARRAPPAAPYGA